MSPAHAAAQIPFEVRTRPYAFVSPAGYQTNLMVQKPGGYTFSDFVKVGLPLTILVGAVALFQASVLYLR